MTEALPDRCEWCAVFVRGGRPLTAWRVRVPERSRQDPTSPWNYWAKLLCPTCAAGFDRASQAWQRVTADEVLRQRGSLRAPVLRSP